jgi:phytanoyl-CoA hydroxylase
MSRGPLPDDHADLYREQGYIAVPGVLGDDVIAELRAVTDEFVERSRSLTASDDVCDLEPGHTAERPRLRRIKSPFLQHPVYDELLRNESVLDCVESLVGPDIRLHSGKLNLKNPDGGQAVEWHQDWAFGPATNDDLLTVGIALDDLMLVNGCLLVVPGSHRGEVCDHWQDGQFTGAVVDPALRLNERAVPIELPVGSISLHHTRTLHASAPNNSALQRRLLLFTYSAADAWPLDGVRDPAAYDAQMLRGSAPRAPRLEQVPVAPWPRWNAEDEARGTSIFDVQARVGRSAFAG